MKEANREAEAARIQAQIDQAPIDYEAIDRAIEDMSAEERDSMFARAIESIPVTTQPEDDNILEEAANAIIGDLTTRLESVSASAARSAWHAESVVVNASQDISIGLSQTLENLADQPDVDEHRLAWHITLSFQIMIRSPFRLNRLHHLPMAHQK